MDNKSQVDFDRLCQIHVLGKTEEYKYMVWECTMLVEYYREDGDNYSTNHKCLVGWNDNKKSESWGNFLNEDSVVRYLFSSN
jgi:hypothetical protein